MSILLLAPLAVRSGYGSLARGLASALAEARPDTAVVDLVDFPGGRLRVDAKLSSLVTAAAMADRAWVRIDVPWRGRYPRPPSAPSYLYTMFEAGPLPAGWIPSLETFDAIIVPSDYCADLFAAAACAPVRVVRPGIDPRFSPLVPPLRLDVRSVVFLFVGEFTHRKGIDILINAYARAFGPADDVTLVVKTWSSRTAPGDIEAAVRSRLDAVSASPPHTVFLHGMLPDELLPSLYTAATALVMPSRSEGFGLPAAEAQACGVALVATDATGLAESAHAPFSYALRTTGTRPARADGLPWDFYDGRPMPEPDEEHLVDILRHIYQHRGEARSRGLAASEVQHRRPWRQAAAELLDVIANHSAIPQGRPHE